MACDFPCPHPACSPSQSAAGRAERSDRHASERAVAGGLVEVIDRALAVDPRQDTGAEVERRRLRAIGRLAVDEGGQAGGRTSAVPASAR